MSPLSLALILSPGALHLGSSPDPLCPFYQSSEGSIHHLPALNRITLYQRFKVTSRESTVVHLMGKSREAQHICHRVSFSLSLSCGADSKLELCGVRWGLFPTPLGTQTLPVPETWNVEFLTPVCLLRLSNLEKKAGNKRKGQELCIGTNFTLSGFFPFLTVSAGFPFLNLPDPIHLCNLPP